MAQKTNQHTNRQMEKKSIIIVIALALTSFVVSAQNTIDKQGRRQGHWVRTDKDGAKIYEGDFVDGLETGTFTYYYGDGTVRIRNTYTTPGKICNHEAYDENGHLMARGSYNQRNRDGRWLFFAPDGHVVKEAAYSMGIKEGMHVIYTQTGDTAEVTHWKNNRRHGRWWKRVGDGGYITATYEQGGIEGRLVEYDAKGLLVREGHYSGGLKNGSYRYYENGHLTIDETWTHGTLVDRRILLLTPSEEFISVFDMACLAPKGKAKTMVYLKDGSSKEARESSETIYDRIGNDFFSYANRKNRILVSLSCVQGIGRDNEGRDILLLDPQPDFPIFPDEDGVKLVRSIQYEKDSPLDRL